ncbi:hypothetical protein NADFUDRAFT_81286 [Nadsonia fulvescens var. elongata DSM 6958]|uniref:Pentacotripeptide-repeat region of PRORP domain-containing protein n=1 Tax=Nadsonia fulvescens var. elongata DSM 6958 TaxID=857566 RepID=A0A1E3PSL4_9ASCO|nr:hypothetical protein NADFUDRAFT_81286 [Nadsonia fulvescens var. elongata DSM 6958]
MVFKTFNNITRQAGLAKAAFAPKATSQQPAFFASTNNIIRQNSQLAVRSSTNQPFCFSEKTANHGGYAGPTTSSSFASLTQVSSSDFDDETKRDIVLNNKRIGKSRLNTNSASRRLYNYQGSLLTISEQRLSRSLSSNATSSISSDLPSLEEIYTVDDSIPSSSDTRILESGDEKSRTITSGPLFSTILEAPVTPPSSPTLGPINPTPEEVRANLCTFGLDEALQTLAVSQKVIKNTSHPDADIPELSLTVDTSENHPREFILPNINEDLVSSPLSLVLPPVEKTEVIIPQTTQTQTKPHTPLYSPDHSQVQIQPQTQVVQEASKALLPLSTTAHFSSALLPVQKQKVLDEHIFAISDCISKHEFIPAIKHYAQLKSEDLIPPMETFNNILYALNETKQPGADMEPILADILTVYSDMLEKNVTADVQTYSILISALLSGGNAQIPLIHSSPAFAGVLVRHQGKILSASRAALEQVVTPNNYVLLALEIFNSSNLDKPQTYSMDIYTQLLSTCIEHQLYDKIPFVFSQIDLSMMHNLQPKQYLTLIKSCGYINCSDLAVKIFGLYKGVVSTLKFESDQPTYEFDIYSALTLAYFRSKDTASALKFLLKIMDEKSQTSEAQYLGQVFNSVIKGFAELGDIENGWKWVQRMETDSHSVDPAEPESVCLLLSSSLQSADNSQYSSMIFDYAASRKDICHTKEFAIARCDYISLCILTNKVDELYKIVKESFLHQAMWDETTIFSLCDYYFSRNEVQFGLDIFKCQSKNLVESPFYNETIQEGITGYLFASVLESLKINGCVSFNSIMSIANSVVFNGRVFGDGELGGLEVLRYIWQSRQAQVPEYIEFINSNKVALLDILRLHLIWISSASASNSLGNLSIAAPLFDELKLNFNYVLGDVISSKIRIEPSFADQIEEAIRSLNDGAIAERFHTYYLSQTKRMPSPKPDPLLNVAPSEEALINMYKNRPSPPDMILLLQGQPPRQTIDATRPFAWDVQVTNEIVSLVHVDNVTAANQLLNEAIQHHRIVGPDAFLAMMDLAGNKKYKTILVSAYEHALQMIPPPRVSAQSYDMWNALHRCAVANSAELDPSMCEFAYRNLIQMGSAPDATGYGQLIISGLLRATQSSSGVESHNEANDAVDLFMEAKSRNVTPNTFLYNVLLSKLAKARRVKEALMVFEEMSSTKTKKTSVTYGTMISCCCRVGDGDRAMALFNEMELSPNYTPKVAPYNTLLQYFVQAKRDRAASMNIYERLRANKQIEPSPHTYKLIIDMFSLIEPVDLESADRVILSIKEDGNLVATQHYAALILARGVSLRRLDLAQDFYRRLISSKTIRPDKIIFQALLECYVVNGQVKATASVLVDMERYNIEMNAYMGNILIRGWAVTNVAKSQALFDLIHKAKISEPSTFEALVRAYIYHGRFDDARQTLEIMRKADYPGPVVAKVENFINATEIFGESETELLVDSIFRVSS